MEMLREIVDSSVLEPLILLPHSFKNRRLEITITPAPEIKSDEEKIHLTKPMMDNLLQSDNLRSLTGLLHTDMTAEEIRVERLKKYECAN